MKLHELFQNLVRPFKRNAQTDSIVIFIEDSKLLVESAQQILREAKYEKVPGSQIVSRYDSANTTTKTDGHHHFLLNGNELYAVNDSGTAHHRSNRGVTLDRKVADYLGSKGVPIPPNRVLEEVDLKPQAIYRKYLLQALA